MPYTYQYPHFAVTTDAVIFTGPQESREVLLIRRANEPFKDKWAFPGGFVDNNELLDDAVRRELMEETCVDANELLRFDVFDAIGRDPRERTITMVYYGFVDRNNVTPKAGDDAGEVRWFSVSELPDMAFDHRTIIRKLLAHLGTT